MQRVGQGGSCDWQVVAPGTTHAICEEKANRRPAAEDEVVGGGAKVYGHSLTRVKLQAIRHPSDRIVQTERVGSLANLCTNDYYTQDSSIRG